MKEAIREAVFSQAAQCLRGGMRFQFRADAIGGEDQIKGFITRLSVSIGGNVRANCGHGLVTLYSEGHDGTDVVVATIKHGASS